RGSHFTLLADALNSNSQLLWIPELNAVPVDSSAEPLGFVPLRNVRQTVTELIGVVRVAAPRSEVRHRCGPGQHPLRMEVARHVLRDCGPVHVLREHAERSVFAVPSPVLPVERQPKQEPNWVVAIAGGKETAPCNQVRTVFSCMRIVRAIGRRREELDLEFVE